MATDPICGMTVDETTGRSVELNNQIFWPMNTSDAFEAGFQPFGFNFTV